MTPSIRLPPFLVFAMILHAAVFPQLRIFDVRADVFLVVAIAAGLAGGPERGAVVGFVAGMLTDLFLQTPFGLSGLTFCLIGWAVGSFQTRILHTTWWIPMVTAAVASAGGVLLFAGLGAVVGENQLISVRLLTVMSVTALWSAMLIAVVVRLMRWCLMVDTTRGGLVLR
jgi:rod shape-determining protein MreD